MKHIVLNAHLIAHSGGYRSAGIHRYIHNTLIHLPKVSSEYTYSVFLNKNITLQIPQIHEEHSRFDTLKPWRRILWEQAIQPFAIQRLKPDLYHGMAFVAPMINRYPSIVTVYDLSFKRFPHILSRSRHWYLQTFTKISCDNATRVIAISQSTARDLTELLNIPAEKIDIALPGVDPEFCPLPPETVERFRAEKKLPNRFILFVGTLEPRKNLPMLIRAYAQLPADLRHTVHLVLGGGKGWQYEDIFATIETHRLENTVHTVGYIPADELALWYNAAEIFAYPTLFEGFGIPILEAMACGKPVLASNTSSLPEAAGDVGILLPPDDPSAWTHTLQKAITDRTWQGQKGQDGQAWSQTFSWQRTAHQTHTSYQKALG